MNRTILIALAICLFCGGAWQAAWWFSAGQQWRAFAATHSPTHEEFDLPPHLASALTKIDADLQASVDAGTAGGPAALVDSVQKRMNRRMFAGVLAAIVAFPMVIVLRGRKRISA